MPKRIWAPWRYQYITGEKTGGCVFCQIAADSDDEKNLVLYRGTACYIVLNRYPYTNGHLMVIPYQHTDTPQALELPVLAEMMLLNNLCISALSEGMHPDGLNIGMNIGKAAGAGIREHIHLHIVPRWVGDHNYMPVIGETRVISQSLEDTFSCLLPIISRLAGESSHNH